MYIKQLYTKQFIRIFISIVLNIHYFDFYFVVAVLCHAVGWAAMNFAALARAHPNWCVRTVERFVVFSL